MKIIKNLFSKLTMAHYDAFVYLLTFAVCTFVFYTFVDAFVLCLTGKKY